jgi:hypothetical protein
MRRLRHAYFATAADSAGRYGIEFGHVLAHLWGARRARSRLCLRSVRFMDDLVHVVACTRNRSQAWMDLIERNEHVLTRRCAEHVGDMEAVLLVRGLFATLRRPSADGGTMPLGAYSGEQPVRAWLAERLMGRIHAQHRVWCLWGRLPRPAARTCYTVSPGRTPGAGVGPAAAGVIEWSLGPEDDLGPGRGPAYAASPPPA